MKNSNLRYFYRKHLRSQRMLNPSFWDSFRLKRIAYKYAKSEDDLFKRQIDAAMQPPPALRVSSTGFDWWGLQIDHLERLRAIERKPNENRSKIVKVKRPIL